MAELTRIVPCLWFDDEGEEAANRAIKAMLGMRKLDVAELQRAADAT